MFSDISFKNKVAVITGGASGIGKTIAGPTSEKDRAKS